MDDTSSIASFEEVGPSNRSFQEMQHEADNVEKLKNLVAKAALNDGAAKELGDDEVPDVCYVLQYKGWGGKLIDVRRSQEPINIELDDMDDDRSSTSKKPVLEIVTKVSASIVQKRQDDYLPPPRFPRWNPPVNYNRYDDYGHPDKKDDDSEMKITKVETTNMVIHSPYLINALRAVVGYYPSTSFLGDTAKVSAPYTVLVHHRAALARYKVIQPETHDQEYVFTTAKHIDILLKFLEKTLGEQIREEEKRHNSPIPSATFDNLPLILKPGEIVYAKQDHRWTPFVISSVDESYINSHGAVTSHVVNCWNISYSTERFCRMMHAFPIDPFTGEEAIAGLPVIPARFFTGEDHNMNPEEIQAKHIALGRKVWELSKAPSYMSYDGSLAERSPDDNWEYPASATGYMSGRVIVDCAGFNRYSYDCPGSNSRRPRSPSPPNTNSRNRPPPRKDQLPYFGPRCGCSACNKSGTKELSPFSSFEDLDPTTDAAPKYDLYYLALSKVVPGFILGERRWGHFNVEYLDEVQFDKEAFKYLVLDDEVKFTVRALIGKFASANGQVSPWPSDFVKNKGQGRIFLLHGSPGVGKTCTAECVAELTHRPLLSLTSGDLSTNSYNVEKNLEYFLQLGERFGAMVLLDEADVYLESRRMMDIERNGLVSIFLRALEYYRGVLFLTTNRVKTFDSAFTSRIHVALHYKALTDADREKIWLSSFERLERDSGGKVYVSVATREYAYESRDVQSLRWNGREIRNAIQTAVALAESEALEDGVEMVTVTDKHLKAVVKMSRGFKNFLRKRGVKTDDDVEAEDEDDDDEEEDSDED